MQRNPPKLFLTVSVLVWPADDWSGTELTGWLRLSWERRPITGQHHLSQIYRQLGSSCAAHSLSSSEVGEVVHSMTNVQNFSPWWVKTQVRQRIRDTILGTGVVKISIAEKVVPKLFEIWSRNYLFNKYLLQSVWRMPGWRKTNCYLHWYGTTVTEQF